MDAKAALSNPMVVEIYRHEIERQAQYAWTSAGQIDALLTGGGGIDHELFWSYTDSALSSMARLSDLLWPAFKGDGAGDRGTILCSTFGIPACPVLTNKKARNAMEHAAERIDGWADAPGAKMFADSIIGPPGTVKGIAGPNYARIYGPTTSKVTIFGDSMVLKDAIAEVATILGIVRSARQLLHRHLERASPEADDRVFPCPHQPPKPIRYDVDTRLCMRDNPIHPKAIIERRRDGRGDDVFLAARWDLDPGARVLMGTTPTLERADLMVRWDLPAKRDGRDGPPNGVEGDGVQRCR